MTSCENILKRAFMDVFVPDLNGILRGKRIQAEEFSKVFGNGSNYVASTPLMNVLGDLSRNHQLW